MTSLASFVAIPVQAVQNQPEETKSLYELSSVAAAAAAALAALASTALAVWVYVHEKRSGEVDRLSRYYDKRVATPIMQALELLKARTTGLVQPAVEEITKMCAVDATQNAVRSRVKKLVDDFEREYRSLREIVATVIGSWEDGSCNDALRQELEAPEDNVKTEMSRLAVDQGTCDPREVMASSTARSYAAILEQDPAARRAGQKRRKTQASGGSRNG